MNNVEQISISNYEVIHRHIILSSSLEQFKQFLHILSDHNYERETTVKGYEGPGEYRADLVYRDPFGKKIEATQLANLVDNSDKCRQHISWNCTSAAFNSPATETKAFRLTYWVNRNDQEMTYW